MTDAERLLMLAVIHNRLQDQYLELLQQNLTAQREIRVALEGKAEALEQQCTLLKERKAMRGFMLRMLEELEKPEPDTLFIRTRLADALEKERQQSVERARQCRPRK